MVKLTYLGEFGLIERLSRLCPCSNAVIKGIGDDTAVLRSPVKKQLLLTTDMLVENVHFTRKTKGFLIGRKALACNISDIAAMGGIPKSAVVSLGISGREDSRFVDEVYRGIGALAKEFKVDIVGGDTVKTHQLIINIALTGEASMRDIVYRSGAKVGDKIFVTGELGNSLKSGHHLTFTPRLAESQFLVKKYPPHSMIDISDGLIADLGHILKQSKVGACLYEDQIPLRKGARVADAFKDGEDFELLFTLPPDKASLLRRQKKFNMTEIGEIVPAAQGYFLMDDNGRKESLNTSTGYQHF
ncbi:MAG: thiamine-monophosphate kinase [Candidatus Omnitrophica bacterium]|nr:thiamine-monophosphate kinase [Candidatus Omnitrophota bacterium]